MILTTKLIYISIYQASPIIVASDVIKTTTFYNLQTSVYYMDCIDLFYMFYMQINKPHLPLASGEISFTTGVIIIASSFIVVLYRFIPFYIDIFQDEIH